MSADNSTVVQLEGDILLVNQLELVTPTTVAGTLYGIAFTLFCLYVHSLASRLRDEDRKRQARFMLGYSIIIMLCGVFYLIATTWITQNAYIKHNDYPDGPYSYEDSTLRTPIFIATFLCLWVVDTLTSAIQIWRVWVVWGATRYANFVAILPSLCFLTFVATRLRLQVLQATVPLQELVQLSRDKIAQVGYAMEGSVTVLCTLLISLYLIVRHWHQRKLIGKAQGSAGYIGVVAMLIESYALESIWLLISTIISKASLRDFFAESVPYIEIISYLLVLYRVANGTAYESQKSRQDISSLHWNHGNYTAQQQPGNSSGLCSGPYCQSHAHIQQEPSGAPQVYNMA